MKLLSTFLLVLSFLTCTGQSLINWDEIILGTASVFHKYKVCSVAVIKNDTIFKTVIYDKRDNVFTVLNASRDTLYRMVYDKKNRIRKVIRAQRELIISYWENDAIVKSLSMISSISPSVDTIQITSFPYQQQPGIVQNELYVITKTGGDTLLKTKKIDGNIINEEDSTLNYVWEVNNEKEIKKYPNQDWKTATTTYYDSYYSYDSIAPFNDGGKRRYHYFFSLIYPDSTIQTVIKDTTYKRITIRGKLKYEKISFSNKDIIEFFYNDDSTISQKVLYKYYPNRYDDSILWKKITVDSAGILIKTEYPNKNRYKYRKGTLILKKKQPIVKLQHCGGGTLTSYEYDYGLWLMSSSLFFDYEVESNILRNYDLSIDIKQTLSINNILKDNDEVYYEPWFFAYGAFSSLNNFPPIDFKNKKITVPSEDYMSSENKYRINLSTQNGQKMISPIYSEKQIKNFQYNTQMIIFKYLKRVKRI